MDAQRQLVKNVLLLALSYFHLITQILAESLIHSLTELTAKISCSICGKKKQLWLQEIHHKSKVKMFHVHTELYIVPCISTVIYFI